MPLPNCPECVAREKKKIQEEYEVAVPEEEDRNRDDLFRMFDEISIPMKLEPRTKHYVCRTCGLYATREQIGDIRARLNKRVKTKEDRQYEYQEWWSKSKRDKAEG